MPVIEVLNCTAEAKEMLEVWRKSYNDTRQKIEDSGRGQRWEFDKRRLFNASDYMAFVCKDLHDVATVHFYTSQFLVCTDFCFFRLFIISRIFLGLS